MRHKWKWSPTCNGRGVCLRCMLKTKPLRRGGLPGVAEIHRRIAVVLDQTLDADGAAEVPDDIAIR